MRVFNSNRVIYYGRYDWAAGEFKDRIESVLPGLSDGHIESINDAIEAYQCKLTIEDISELFAPSELPELNKRAASAFSNACRYVNQFLEIEGVFKLYDQLEKQYLHQFWELLELCGAEEKLTGDDLAKLLEENSYCLSCVLEMPTFVKRFDFSIKEAMVKIPFASAEVTISGLAMDSQRQKPIHLPPSLVSSCIDSIMLAYLDSEHLNPNYVETLTRWPSRQVNVYRPSPEVCVKAKRVFERDTKELLAEGRGLSFTTEVTIDMRQCACRGASIKDQGMTVTFGGQWLNAYMDFATIMNNCRWVFDYIGRNGLMQMPTRPHEERGLIALLGPHVRGEYRNCLAAQQRQSISLLETQAYASFLEGCGRSLEETLEWVYGIYFLEEYGINGFGISLPSRDGTWLDKCKGIGSEIERVMKGYQLYAERGVIEDEYFPYSQFRSFADAPALAERKYVIKGDKFMGWAQPLFSDQSPLAFVHEKSCDAHTFYGLMLTADIVMTDYKEPFRIVVKRLVDNGLVEENPTTGRLKPTQKAACLRMVWEDGAILTRRYGGGAKETANNLVQEGMLEYHSGLFTPAEASFLNFMLNNSEQSNAIGLRNKYSHANGVIENPDADNIRSDYYMMLALLVSITLKINDELVDVKGKPGGIDFVDWPFIDESAYKAAAELADKNMHEKDA